MSEQHIPITPGLDPAQYPCWVFRPKDGWVRFLTGGSTTGDWYDLGWTHYSLSPTKPESAPTTSHDEGEPEVITSPMCKDDTGPTEEQVAAKRMAGFSGAVRMTVFAMNALTDDERMEVMGAFCKSCGSKNPNCQCWNDE